MLNETNVLKTISMTFYTKKWLNFSNIIYCFIKELHFNNYIAFSVGKALSIIN